MAGITRTTRHGGMFRQVYHALRALPGRIRHPGSTDPLVYAFT